MSKTAFATDDALTKKLWEEKLFRDMKKESYFSKFMGKDSNSLVQEQDNLIKEKGDRIRFGIRMRLTGAGVTSGIALEGNEESLTTHSSDVTLEEYAHATRDAGPLDRQRVTFSIDEESVNALKDWGSEKIDELSFTAIELTPTKIIFGGDATATGDVEVADLMTPALISKVKAGAKTGYNRTQTPLRPIRINGKNYFVMLIHPDVGYDLKVNTIWTQAQRDARERGSDNPIFTGMLGVWDNVIIHEHENVTITTDWGAGSNIAGAQCSFMGAQSLIWGWGKRPEVVAETFDYKREHGFAWGMLSGVAKPVFNSKDYGSVGVYVARTQISDA